MSTSDKYILPELSDDDTFVYNLAIVNSAADTAVYYSTTSIDNYGERTWNKTDTIIEEIEDAENQAWIIVNRYDDSKLRCMNLNIYPDADPTNLYPEVLGFDISKRITLNLNNTNNPYAIPGLKYHIEGIEHDWDAKTNKWETKWQLWDINQYSICSELHDGYLRENSNVDYNDAHSTTDADATANDALTIDLGQKLVAGTEYQIYRGFIELDTSGLAATATITTAKLLLYVNDLVAYTVDTQFDITLVDNSTLVNPLVSTDYGVLLAETVSMGSCTISTPSIAPGWIEIPLNATGIAHITLAGTTRFGIRSSRDISADAPTVLADLEFVGLWGLGSAYEPRFIVELA